MGQPQTPAQYPLTSRQLDPGGTERAPKHVIPLALRIKGQLSIDALRGALDEVVRRHESLRTRVHYSETGDSPGFQEVLTPLPVPFTVHDITPAPGATRDQSAIEVFAALHDELLAFTVTPSLRAALHRFDDRDAILTLLTHHLYSDGWSAEILRHEFTACYRARISGIPHDLPAPVQYRQYATWEQDFLANGKAAAARAYWAGKLAGAQMYTMPADRAHSPATLAPRSAVRSFVIEPAAFSAAGAAATAARCTPWHLFLAATMALAWETTAATDITLLTVDHGRPHSQFHQTIGFFANLVPLRLQFAGCSTYRDLMLTARTAGTEAHKHHIPFPAILELAPGLMKAFDDPGAVPPAYTYISAPLALADDPGTGTTFDPVILPDEVPMMFHRGACIWSFNILPTGAFRCVIEYEPDAADAATIDTWGTRFTTHINAIASNPTHPWKTR